MTDSTPLNADDELREKVQDICDRVGAGLLPPTGAGAIMQITLADRKKHELQARIDELRLASDMQYMMRREDRINYCSKRIAELKAQQEEV